MFCLLHDLKTHVNNLKNSFFFIKDAEEKHIISDFFDRTNFISLSMK